MSGFPEPVPGLVIRYAYLWRREFLQGRDEGVKDRPCAIVLATAMEDGDTLVTVLPVTHTPPTDVTLSVELPPETKRRLGLDDDRSWVIVSEANRFIWPGPDLRPLKPGDPSSIVYGLLPRGLLREIRDKLMAALSVRQAATVKRSE